MPRVVIERLTKAHRRAEFDCGNPDLDRFIQTLARQHQEKGFSVTYVAVREGDAEVLGYISIAMGSVALEDLDEATAARLPRHPVPVVHIARLATDVRFAGKGIASLLLAHAADLALKAADQIGAYALELAAVDQMAFDFYVRRGFLPLRGNAQRLYVPIETLRKAKPREGTA